MDFGTQVSAKRPGGRISPWPLARQSTTIPTSGPPEPFPSYVRLSYYASDGCNSRVIWQQERKDVAVRHNWTVAGRRTLALRFGFSSVLWPPPAASSWPQWLYRYTHNCFMLAESVYCCGKALERPPWSDNPRSSKRRSTPT